VNTLNQYTSDAGGTAEYDAKGNLSAYARWTVKYDAVNRLTELHNNGLNRHIIYKYDVLNRRIAQSVNETITSYVFDNWNQIEERPPDRQPRCYLFGGATNEVVVSFGSGYQNYFYFQDGRGNSSHLTDNANVLIERYTYDLNGSVSYLDGNNTPITGSVADNRFLFAGAILLPETNLYDMRNRIYFPGWGRFLQTDPIGFKGDASNLYRYCGNDPVDRSDPLGLEVIPYTGPMLEAPTLKNGAGMGATGVEPKVVTHIEPDGAITLRLETHITGIVVAQRMKFHGRWKVRSDDEKKVTFNEHEKGEHVGKDWVKFDKDKTKELPTTRYKDPDAAAAKAKELTEKFKHDAFKANGRFEQHQPESRWKPIQDRELPHH
jgi:RHS repeat-associated protein